MLNCRWNERLLTLGDCTSAGQSWVLRTPVATTGAPIAYAADLVSPGTLIDTASHYQSPVQERRLFQVGLGHEPSTKLQQPLNVLCLGPAIYKYDLLRIVHILSHTRTISCALFSWKLLSDAEVPSLHGSNACPLP